MLAKEPLELNLHAIVRAREAKHGFLMTAGERAAFPDLDFSIKEQIAEGEKVVSRFEWTGTHQQQFLGVPATGRPVQVWGVVIDRLEGGRIKDTRIIMDTLGLMMQLGVFPPPGA